MRIRSIKPEFWTSDDITALAVDDRLLFIGLWSYVDDNGVGRGHRATCPAPHRCGGAPQRPLRRVDDGAPRRLGDSRRRHQPFPSAPAARERGSTAAGRCGVQDAGRVGPGRVRRRDEMGRDETRWDETRWDETR